MSPTKSSTNKQNSIKSLAKKPSNRITEADDFHFYSSFKKLIDPIKFTQGMADKIQKFVTKIVRNIPIVSDYYYYYWYFFRNLSYRGVFNTYSEALKALPSGSRISHSQPEIHNHHSVAQLTTRRELGKLDLIDYPMVFWLKSAFNDGSTVFDLGGNVGVSYYACRKYLQYPSNLRWLVCELPELIIAGEKLAREIDSPGLSFTGDFAKAEGMDILLTVGTLQYLELSLADILGELKVKPRHILINHTPFYEGESFITLQNIGYAFSPYKIQNRISFLASLTSIGYELIDSWKLNRTCFIPFHSERFVHNYYGFYLRLSE